MFDHSVSVTPNQSSNHNINVEMNFETVLLEVNNEHSELSTESLQIPSKESTNTEKCVNKTVFDEPVLCRLVQVCSKKKNRIFEI